MPEPHADPDGAVGSDEPQSEGQELESLLQEEFGEDAEVSVDDFKQWAKDQKGWLRKMNSRNKSIAQREKEISERAAELSSKVAEIETLKTQLETRATQDNGRQRARSNQGDPEAFFESIGAEAPEDPVTAEAMYRVLVGAQSWLNEQLETVASPILEELSRTANRLDQVGPKAERAWDTVAELIQEASVASVMKEYPNADEKVLRSVIATHEDQETLEDALLDAAKESHDRVGDKLREAGVKPKPKGKKKSILDLAAASGGSTTRDKIPNPWTRQGMKELGKQLAAESSE